MRNPPQRRTKPTPHHPRPERNYIEFQRGQIVAELDKWLTIVNGSLQSGILRFVSCPGGPANR
ncbi:MAG: hypothetical protein WBD80_13780, partial [Xanthobacteraceae bacterium]